MRDIPIIFSAPMVRALIDGRKTQTRRLAWGEPFAASIDAVPLDKGWMREDDLWRRPSPWQKVEPGDRLWVRENIAQRQGEFFGIKQNVIEAAYEADGEDVTDEIGFNLLPWWKTKGTLPCIHMPRRVSRLTLIVEMTKIEPLDAISEEDAKAEGVAPNGLEAEEYLTYAGCYWELWKQLHGKESFLQNPDVVAITFRVVLANIDAPEAKAA